ncbi:hypothetical protein HK405_001541, partial [Cladochytrium tenue]
VSPPCRNGSHLSELVDAIADAAPGLRSLWLEGMDGEQNKLELLDMQAVRTIASRLRDLERVKFDVPGSYLEETASHLGSLPSLHTLHLRLLAPSGASAYSSAAFSDADLATISHAFARPSSLRFLRVTRFAEEFGDFQLDHRVWERSGGDDDDDGTGALVMLPGGEDAAEGTAEVGRKARGSKKRRAYRARPSDPAAAAFFDGIPWDYS